MLRLLITLLTFPGVMVHELAHLLCCKLTSTPVYAYCLFQLNNPLGYVIHAPPTNGWAHLFIATGPFLVNTVTGLLLAALGASFRFSFSELIGLELLAWWLAMSVAIHAFPSVGDAEGIWQYLHLKGSSFLLKLVGIPLIGLIYLGAIATGFLWVDLIYAVFVTFMGHTLARLLV